MVLFAVTDEVEEGLSKFEDLNVRGSLRKVSVVSLTTAAFYCSLFLIWYFCLCFDIFFVFEEVLGRLLFLLFLTNG